MSTTNEQPQQKQVSLADINVDNENTALNVMVAMLNMAQRRGAFTLEESSKCWDCVKMFMRKDETSPHTVGPADATSGQNEVL
jgi:hypothetical protein